MEPPFKLPQNLKKVNLPFSDANLRQVNIIADLHSNLFQAIAYFNYNHFEIELWLEAPDEIEYSAGSLLETLEKEALEKIFVQCLALWNMSKAVEFDFIDFKHFELLTESFTDRQSCFTVKFDIRIPVTQRTENGNEKDKELKHLLACFQKNKYLSDLNEENYAEKFNSLKGKYIFSRQQAYVYRYDEFASALLNAYPIDELKNETNIKIKIKTTDPIQKKIIKRHLYRDYVAEDIFFIDVDSHWPPGSLCQCIFELVSEAVEKNSPAGNDNISHPGNDPISIIQFLDLFLRKSAFKYFVLIIDHLKSKEDAQFINYLVHAAGISHIVLIIFDNPAQVSASVDFLEFDLELNETPTNLLENYLHFDDVDVPIPLKRDNEDDFFHDYLENADVQGKIPTAEILNAGLKYAVKTCRVKELNELLKEYFLAVHKDNGDKEKDKKWSEIAKLDFSVIKMFLVENLELLEKETVNPGDFVETLRFLVEILTGEGDWALAVSLIGQHMAKDPVFLKLKLAHFYAVEKDHPRMHALLEEIKGHNYEPWADEFNYLNYLYYEKILNIKNADFYLKKIKNSLFLHLANIKLSDRYIYQGNFDRAGQLLTEAAVYLEEKNYLENAINAHSQYAKLLRQKQKFAEAEKIYKNLFIKSETYHFRLLSAYISIDLGNLYLSRDDFNQVELWYRKALKIFQILNNKNGIMLAGFNLVEINKIKGNWQETEKTLKSILAFDRERGTLDSLAVDYFNIAHLEYLRHNEAGAYEYLKKAQELFEKRKNAAGIIECRLLNLRLSYLFPCSPATKNDDALILTALSTKYREYMTKDQEILFDILAMLMNKTGRSCHQANFTANVLKKIEQIQSRLFRFEILSLWILAGSAGKSGLLDLLKSLSMQLSMKTRDYHYYEYYYIYFNERLRREKKGIKAGDAEDNHICDSEKEIFKDMYYFFLKNKRKLTSTIIKYKDSLDQEDSAYDVFRSAELVVDSAQWNMPADFFNSLVKELKKIISVDRIQLNIYENTNKTPVFQFSTENKFKEITDEIMTGVRHNLENLNLSLEGIKQSYKNSEKAFYPYRNTKVLFWKLSNTLFGILLLGFLKEDYLDYDLNERNPELLKKLGSLIYKYYENNYKVKGKLSWLIGESPAMKRLKEQIIKVSNVDFALLIRGESGSGKELVAKGVHYLSKRSGKPFVPVNAAAIPENLLEAELFGYKKGAFTGASENKIGLIESANQGTLFLDEIADLPLNLQAKLLRVLQENEIRRLGEVNVSRVDFRLICATNKDLKKLILQDEFRGDLYFRIQDLTIDVPPLVDRTGDIPLLVQYFLEKYKFPVKEKSELQRITRYLQSLNYIGNVRELESTVKRLITYYPDFEIETGINDPSPGSPVAANAYNAGAGLIAARENLERIMIYNALRENDWNKNKAAQSLKISRQYIGILIKKYNIKE